MAPVKTRQLSDLFNVGEELVLDDGRGPVTVWLQKLNPLETEQAVRRSNAARAKVLIEKNNKESDVYLSSLNELLDFNDEELVVYVASSELAQRTERIEAEWAEESGWLKDDYLQSLYDTWNEPGVQEKFFAAENEDDPDPAIQKVFDEMQRYANELNEELVKHLEYIKEEYTKYSRERLIDMMVDKIVKMHGDMAWMIEYRKCEVWMGVRKPDRTKAFKNRHDVDELQQETLTKLIDAMTNLSVEAVEGKGLEETELSSNS